MLDGRLTERSLAVRPGLERASRLAAVVRRHAPFAVLLVVAAALRVVALVAIYPGIWFPDTNEYVRTATTGVLSIVRVSGYSLFVAPFVRVGGFAPLIVVQHLLGLAIVVVLYALLLRRGASRLVAFLGAVPAALDAYLIDLEHVVMSETVFHLVVVGAIALALWNERPRLAATFASGLLLGYAATVRSVAVPFIGVFVLYLLVRRLGLRRVAVLAAGWAIVVVAYMSLFRVQHGQFAFTLYGGHFLYAKAGPIADCSRLPDLPADERSLCPNPKLRLPPNGYLWSRKSPAAGLGPSADDRLRDFSLRVIENNPRAYAREVAGNFLHYFEPGYRNRRVDVDRSRWEFPANPHRWKIPGYRGPIRPGTKSSGFWPQRYVSAVAEQPALNTSASRFLHYYQRMFWTSGQVLTLCLVVVGAALFRGRDWRLRLDAALLATLSLVAILVAAVLSVFDYRYGLNAVVLLPPAAALAFTSFRPPIAGAMSAGEASATRA